MEFDTSKKSEDGGEHKEPKKKKPKKRTPARVPLPIEEKVDARKSDVEKEKKPKHKKSHKEATPKQPEEAVAAAEKNRPKPEAHDKKPAEEIRVPTAETPKHEVESTQTHEVSLRRPDHEAEVPLHVVTEGEVFVSERLQPEPPEEHEAVEIENSVEQAEPEIVPENEVAEPGEDEDVTATAATTQQRTPLQHNPQQQQQTKAAGPGGHTKGNSGAAAAGAGSSPFLAQWRNRNAAGAGGNVPPTPPSTPYPSPNFSPNNPNFTPFGTQNPNALPITSTPVPEQVRDRFSERRHLVTGLVVGALIEHVRHKRREKRMDKAHKKEVRELEKKQQGAKLTHQVEQNKNVREKTALEKTIERLEKAVVPAAVATKEKPATPPAAKVEKPAEALSVKSAEEAKKELEERARKAVEMAREPDDELEIPEEHRLVNSSWHAIEVDKKTGKAVENQSFGYGEAFHQEQHQEQLHSTAATSRDTSNTDDQHVSTQSMPLPTYQQKNSHESSEPQRQSRGEKIRETSTDFAEAAAHVVGKIQPIDAMLWVILGIIILIIFKLL